MDVYDVYAAAFLMSWGCRLLGTSQDDRGWMLFRFDAHQATDGLRAWSNPQTVVRISDYLTHLRYLRSLMKEAA